eukprot:1876749-Rhodomonas_salina.1
MIAMVTQSKHLHSPGAVPALFAEEDLRRKRSCNRITSTFHDHRVLLCTMHPTGLLGWEI